jgi:1-acyl-sn-glycerol-3-phosphate acyltransferase
MVLLGKVLRSYSIIFLIILYTIVLGSSVIIIWAITFGRRRFTEPLAPFWARLLLWTSRVTVTVEGIEHLKPNERYVFTANHQSQYDTPACIFAIPLHLRILAKKELFRIPFLGWGIAVVGHIKIDRENTDKALASIEKAVHRFTNEDISLLIFPEGTRSPDGKIHHFKKGGFALAIQSQRPVVPVTIIGSRAVLPKKSLIINPGNIHIIIDEPIPTTGLTFSDRDTLAKTVQEVIIKHFSRYDS